MRFIDDPKTIAKTLCIWLILRLYDGIERSVFVGMMVLGCARVELAAYRTIML